ncbi:MAG: universal stress protein, partial [Mobilicoccus sp.]|nr:universal stress protein [Mobilicoccus sp.]
YIATHAHGPVAVVPQQLFEELDAGDPIVLGIDGRSDDGATRFAFAQAAALGRPIVAVHSSRHGDVERDGTDLQEVLDRVLNPVAEQYPQVEVRRNVVHEDSDVALLGASARAAMLVVGTRARGELRSVLFGSTSTRLLGRATCPAVVVPESYGEGQGVEGSARSRGGATATAPVEEAEGSPVEEVLELERATLSPEYRRQPGKVRELLADDFHEVGRSGREFVASDFADTVDAIDRPVSEKVVESMDARSIAPDVVLVSTTLLTDGHRSRHTSVWRREGRAWSMVHHQGTWVEGD